VVDLHALASRLSALEGYRAKLEAFRRFSRDEFLGDEDLYQLAERYLHLACECMLDAAQHVIAEMGFRQPNDYKDAVEILCEEDILPRELAERIKGWMGFRNVLVHFYLGIDHQRAFGAIQSELGDLDEFAAEFARLLDE
jgi:uncharacterized protein YutE (UPF0331/DUF86 family)